MLKKHAQKVRRASRTRARIHGTAERPRLSVFRSAKHFAGQLINDDTGKTIVSVNDMQLADRAGKKPVDIATALGSALAEKAVAAGVTLVVFDRGSFAYHGRVKAFAEAAREAGLTF